MALFAPTGARPKSILTFTLAALAMWSLVLIQGSAQAETGEKALDPGTAMSLSVVEGPRYTPPSQVLLQSGMEAGFADKPDEEIRLLTRAIDLSGLDKDQMAQAYFNRGLAYSKKNEYRKAVGDYTRAMEIWPKRADLFFHRGKAFQHLGFTIEAIIDFTRAHELDSQNLDALIERGTVWYLKGDYIPAIKDYSRVLEANPSLAKAYLLRSRAYEMRGDLPRAIQDLGKYISFMPSQAVTWKPKLKELEAIVEKQKQAKKE